MSVSFKLSVISNFMIHFLNIELLLIPYLCCEMVKNAFVLLDLLSNNSKC